MPRKPRKAPTREPDPMDEYSTWDLRIAKTIYYALIVGVAVSILGIWLTIIAYLIETGGWQFIEELGAGIIALIIIGIIVGHLFLLVLFYILFRGGILKLCQRLFKDRVLAKKYEDYTTLRLLVAVTLVSVYIFVITLVVVIIPSFLWNWIGELWAYVIINFNWGEWVLLIGIILLIIVGLVYVGFVLWNHAVYAVLKRVKRIEEEYEIKEEIKREELRGADEETLQKTYEKETGKIAIYRGKETKGYKAWKKKYVP
ncbi:MAG: hypothetical protein ACFE8V_14610 [Promethearchaeota archaeon]